MSYDTDAGVWVEPAPETSATLANDGFAGLLLVVLAGLILLDVAWEWFRS